VGRLLAQLGSSCQHPLFRAYEQKAGPGEAVVRARLPDDSGVKVKTRRRSSSGMRLGCGRITIPEGPGVFADRRVGGSHRPTIRAQAAGVYQPNPFAAAPAARTRLRAAEWRYN
jgi:hypothetical protein